MENVHMNLCLGLEGNFLLTLLWLDKLGHYLCWPNLYWLLSWEDALHWKRSIDILEEGIEP
jgi:hypothetical protein